MKAKLAIMIALVAVPGLLIAVQPTLAQFKSVGSNAEQQKKEYEASKKKGDDSQYKAALDRLQEKKFDPWANMR